MNDNVFLILDTVTDTFFLFVAMVRARLPSNSAVVEDEKLTLHCIVVGTDPEIKWTIHGTSPEESMIVQFGTLL